MASAERERAPLSEVARIQLWREQIERERSRQKLRTSFGVDPRTLKTVTGKVQGKSLLSATPCASGPIEPRNAEEAAILHAIRELDMVPREKASFPRTAAEEIGWDTEPLEPQPKTGMWYKGRHMCDVTKYADAYATTQGKSPFATRNLAAERPGARAM